ncbi:MAG: PQQ-binding-like beta-propeller repeat protein [Blastocatellia bacterium]
MSYLAEKLFCSNPLCETILASKLDRCPRCQESQHYCPNCQSSLRVLSRFCRNCGNVLRKDYAIEHPNLRLRPSQNISVTVKSIFHLDWEIDLETEMTASPLIARGIIVLTLASGHILILDESDGQVRKELATSPPLSFTPIITDNLLIVATKEGVIAFDLIAALYGNLSRGGLKAWQYQLNMDEQVTKPLLATIDQVIAVVKSNQQTKLIFLDKKTGKLQSDITLQTDKTTNPYLKGKELFIGTKNGAIIAIDITQAKIIASTQAGRGVDTNISPVSINNNLLFVLGDGRIWSCQTEELAANKLSLQAFGDTGGLLINALSANNKYLVVSHGFGIAVYEKYGKKVWDTQLDANSISSQALIVDDWAWVIDDSGIMFFFHIASSVPKLRQRVFQYAVSLPSILTEDRLICSNRLAQVKIFRWD